MDGFLAVCTLFTLSGYLGYVSAVNDKEFSIKKYYLSRLKRLYLPLALVIIVTIIVAKVLPQVSWQQLKNDSVSSLFGYNNFWQISNSNDYFAKHIESPLTHMWYISILIQFELIFPLIYTLFKKIDKSINKKISPILYLILTIISTGYLVFLGKSGDIMTVYYNTFARCFSILFGMMIAIMHYEYKISIRIKNASSILFYIYSCILVLFCIFNFFNSTQFALLLIVATLISIRLIEYAVQKRDEKKPEVINYLSKISYEIYLVQFPVIFFMQSLEANPILKTTLAIAIILLVSCIIHLLIKSITAEHKNPLILLLTFCIVISGCYILINAEDYSIEMAILKAQLDENLKEIEEKNAHYLNNINAENNKKELLLQEIQSGEKQIEQMVHELPVVGIGDSVLLAATPGLSKEFPNGYFDGKVSRTIVDGRKILEELIEQEKVGDIVILALANNGDYILSRNKALMEVVGNKQVYWINAVKADVPEFNAQFAEFAKDYTNLHIIDWENASKDHPEYFYKDGIHVKGDGVEAYAKLVFDTICNDYLKKFRNEMNKELEEINQAIDTQKQGLEDNKAIYDNLLSEINCIDNNC